MKKIYKLILVLAMVLSCTTGHCTHIHDEDCGYNPETGTGCTHECVWTIYPRGKNEPNE